MAVNFNEEYIKNAINDGIDGGAVNSTLEDIINKSDQIGKTPSQIKEVVETIVDMKKEVTNKTDLEYSSDFVKKNNEKIKSALSDGISPNEVATTLIESTNKANDRKAKRRLNFITKLISKMKVKELNLSKNKQNGKAKQKVLTDNNK